MTAEEKRRLAARERKGSHLHKCGNCGKEYLHYTPCPAPFVRTCRACREEG